MMTRPVVEDSVKVDVGFTEGAKVGKVSGAKITKKDILTHGFEANSTTCT